MENNIYHWAASVLDSLRKIRLDDSGGRGNSLARRDCDCAVGARAA